MPVFDSQIHHRERSRAVGYVRLAAAALFGTQVPASPVELVVVALLVVAAVLSLRNATSTSQRWAYLFQTMASVTAVAVDPFGGLQVPLGVSVGLVAVAAYENTRLRPIELAVAALAPLATFSARVGSDRLGSDADSAVAVEAFAAATLFVSAACWVRWRHVGRVPVNIWLQGFSHDLSSTLCSVRWALQAPGPEIDRLAADELALGLQRVEDLRVALDPPRGRRWARRVDAAAAVAPLGLVPRLSVPVRIDPSKLTSTVTLLQVLHPLRPSAFVHRGFFEVVFETAADRWLVDLVTEAVAGVLVHPHALEVSAGEVVLRLKVARGVSPRRRLGPSWSWTHPACSSSTVATPSTAPSTPSPAPV